MAVLAERRIDDISLCITMNHDEAHLSVTDDAHLTHRSERLAAGTGDGHGPRRGASAPAAGAASAATSARRCSPSWPTGPATRLRPRSAGWRRRAAASGARAPGRCTRPSQQLEDEGLATSAETEGKRVYTITDAGADEATAASRPTPAPSRGRSAVRGRAPRPPVPLDRRPRRCAARQVVQAGTRRNSSPTVVAIVDHARRDVYRLLADEPTDDRADAVVDSNRGSPSRTVRSR